MLALIAGCGTVQKISSIAGQNGQWYAVVTEKTPFYRYGPQQGNGPDQQLPKDSIMTVIRPSFGYVKVKLQNGENGYRRERGYSAGSAAARGGENRAAADSRAARSRARAAKNNFR